MYIYNITTRDGQYIGKLKETNIYEYHLNRAAPSFLKMPKTLKNNKDEDEYAAWEYTWRKDLIEHGLKKSRYVKNVQYNHYQYIKYKILQSFQIDKNIPPLNMWNFFKDVWNKSDYESTEALSILLGKHSFKILNTKIDFMGFNYFRSENWKEDLLGRPEYIRKMQTYKSISLPKHEITVKIENYKDYEKWPLKVFERFNNATIDSNKFPIIHKKLNKAIQDTTIERYKNEYQKYFDSLPPSLGNSLEKELNKILKQYSTREELASNITYFNQHVIPHMLNNASAKFYESTGVWADYFDSFIKDWLLKTNFNILPFSKEGSMSHLTYEKKFTEKMQEAIVKNNPFMKNSKAIQKEEISNVSKYRQWKTNVQKEWEPISNFIKDNLDSIWREQIKIYYNKQKQATIY